tara:strand:+ start:4812 stop:5873 length:1062 start_codon:yes stop_codon:yes gene_type:complete
MDMWPSFFVHSSDSEYSQESDDGSCSSSLSTPARLSSNTYLPDDCSLLTESDQQSSVSLAYEDPSSISPYACYLYGVVNHAYLGRDSLSHVYANCVMSDFQLLRNLSMGPGDDPKSSWNKVYQYLYYMPVLHWIPFCYVVWEHSHGATLTLQLSLFSRALDPKRWFFTHPIMAYFAAPLYQYSINESGDEASIFADLRTLSGGLSMCFFMVYWLIEALCMDIHGAINHVINHPDSGFNQSFRGITDRESHASLKHHNENMINVINTIRSLGLCLNLIVTLAIPLWLIQARSITSIPHAFTEATWPIKAASSYTLMTGLFSCTMSTMRYSMTHSQAKKTELDLEDALLPALRNI